MTASDRPEIAAEIAAMRRAWRTRLILAFATMAAIVAFFVFDLRHDPRLAESFLLIGLCYVALGLAFVGVVRFTVSRQERDIRARMGEAPTRGGRAAR